MLSDISLFLHITFNNVCVKAVRCWPAFARCAAWPSARTRSVHRLARTQIDEIFIIDPESRRF